MSDDADIRSITDELTDVVAQVYLGYPSLAETPPVFAGKVVAIVADFAAIATDVDRVYENAKQDRLTASQIRALEKLSEDDSVKDAFISEYAHALNEAGADDAEREGYKLYLLLTEYEQYKIRNADELEGTKEVEDRIGDAVRDFGDFKGYLDHLEVWKSFQDLFNINSDKKFRDNRPPPSIKPWECRIGASIFYVPPTSISVEQSFTPTSLAGAGLRQASSPKTNLGHSQTNISMTLYFPSHESIWGFKGEKSEWSFSDWDPFSQSVSGSEAITDADIYEYLGSLRGLITQFKYSPILPVANDYLNRAHDIDAVALQNLTMSTVSGFPHVVAVTLMMSKMNYAPWMPMVDHFDQCIHWGKFISWLGRGAKYLENKVSKNFIIEEDSNLILTPENQPATDFGLKEIESDGRINKLDKVFGGANFDLYFPVGTPSRLFAADISSFAQPGEDEFITPERWGGIVESLGFSISDPPLYDFTKYDQERNSGTNDRDLLLRYLGLNELVWNQMTSGEFAQISDQIVRDSDLSDSEAAALRVRLKQQWFYLLFDKLLVDDPIFQQIEEYRETRNNDYSIKEWEIPMAKLGIDWDNCIVEGLAVSMSNRFSALQIQGHDEPTFQHIGGGDSIVEVEMTVIGKNNLAAFRKAFQHINGLARLERAHGVLGFFGIKNLFTALAGMKYVLPVSFSVDTIPSYPDAYKVMITLVDFDVMQQRREELDSSIQKELVELYGKRNPFLRIKQTWSAVNPYPDFPLGVENEDGEVKYYLDPDWYFRSFRKNNEDLTHWGSDPETVALVQRLEDLERDLPSSVNIPEQVRRIDEVKAELRKLAENGAELPYRWAIDDDGVVRFNETGEGSSGGLLDPNRREYRYYLGTYGDSQEKVAILDMFPGGTFALGEQDANTKEVEYVTGLNVLSEDLASRNLQRVPHIQNTVGFHQTGSEYIDGSSNPNRQFESMMQDWDYRTNEARMAKAFPTYMLWLIDEGGQFAGIKLFDNLYGLNSVIDFSVSQSSENPIEDTLILRLSNVYDKLSREFMDTIIEDTDPVAETALGRALRQAENRQKNLASGLFDEIVELGSIRMKPGVRIHLRAGYSSNPNQLDTIFNGVVTEVENGDVVTVIAQSDAVELSALVNSQDKNGHSGSLDGGISNLWLSEPRDLMVRLLSMGTSYFKEWLNLGSKGVLFSESKFGIRHFGHILYEPMTQQESTAFKYVQSHVAQELQRPSDLGAAEQANDALRFGENLEDFNELISERSLSSAGTFALSSFEIMKALYFNTSAKRDYELFKRNIYPGNGTGIAQYMGGDAIDLGIMLTQATAYNPPGDADSTTPVWGNSTGPTDDQERDYERNVQTISDYWDDYFSSRGLTEDEFLEIMERSNADSVDLELSDGDSGGFFDFIGNILGPVYDLKSLPSDIVDHISEEAFSGVPYVQGGIQLVTDIFTGAVLGLGTNNMRSALGRFTQGLGQAAGIFQMVNDDDLAGYDEVSFRAQTYMKTVWNLFEVCAAILPNYIVAVRPFEDHSTVFYGKPHWLYTSGVVPITTGVQTDLQLDSSDSVLFDLVRRQNSSNDDEQRMMALARQNRDLSVSDTYLLQNMDPYDMTGSVNGQPTATEADLQTIRDNIINQLQDFGASGEYEDYAEITSGVVDWNTLTELELQEILMVAYGFGEIVASENPGGGEAGEGTILVDASADELLDAYVAFETAREEGLETEPSKYVSLLEAYINYKKSDGQIVTSSTGASAEGIKDFDLLIEQIQNDAELSGDQRTNFIELARRDPATFAYQFGWKYSRVQAWVDPDNSGSIDDVGTFARKKYDEDFSPSVDVLGGNEGRGYSDASDIWLDFRGIYRYRPEVIEIYERYFPLDSDKENFDVIMDAFIRFLWQDPYNRAWVVLKPDRRTSGSDENSTGDNNTLRDYADGTVEPGVDQGSRKWNFSAIDPAWEVFLSAKDLTFDSNGVPISGATKRYMKNNAKQGTNAGNPISGVFESVEDWFDTNIAGVLGLITDTVTGFIATLRMSLAQISTSLQLGGMMQRQANVLNAQLNDSIYYQYGDPGSIGRLVDNPYTRAYGEPVIEIREPFQRVHMISSFDSIISNNIQENLNGVATNITVVSDGKSPVTVSMDRAIPPERQVEKTVESGIYWDNVHGSGFFGFLQPLLHPIEVLRGITKSIEGSSDLLLSKRIGTYHLKKSVEKIYRGEILIPGNSQIRPHDLLYVADIKEKVFGMCAVDRVIHHFTPETGFVTAITPKAIVTANDPGRWTMLSYLGNKLFQSSLRDDMRALMGIKTDRFVSSQSRTIDSSDILAQFAPQMLGGTQYTQGSTALVRELGAMVASGSVNGVSAQDQAILDAEKQVIAGTSLVSLINVGPIAGPVVGRLGWNAWKWVQNELLDQQAVMVQYLNKNGQPMDAGLSSFKASVVGNNYQLSLFPSVFGNSVRENIRDPEGGYRITTDDLLAKIGWTEIETAALQKDLSMYVNRINTDILELSGRGPFRGVDSQGYTYFMARVLDPFGGEGGQVGVIDGDTLNVQVIDPGTAGVSGQVRIRLSLVDTFELEYKNNAYTDFNEALLNPENDLGRLAYEYVVNKFTEPSSRVIGVRLVRGLERERLTEGREQSSARYLGTVFHHAPLGLTADERSSFLRNSAQSNPPYPVDSYLNDGRPRTLNWELIATGYGRVDMAPFNFEEDWHKGAIEEYRNE